jgi:alpha-amylase/alpha-mannosidase (GH57 family)
MNRSICIHGHFYQPPRENPWLEEVELQDSAYPYHDWNERITAECYVPNAVSRILAPDKSITEIVNNYSRISFNFGPTLMSWMARHAKEVHAAIIEADRESRERFSGHGSAIAQVYNHIIMPLANARDKRTQVIWGIRDFVQRFGRRPEGMWLAETAVDTETLEALAEQEILFTILAPRQAGRIRKLNLKRRRDVSGGRIDPRMAYRCRLPSGRSIDLFFYDGPIAQEIAFGGLLASGVEFANRMLGAFDGNRSDAQLAHVATDGETYGHHHRFGDMALAYCLHHIEANRLARLTVYGEFLEQHPPTYEVEIIENTSWSCAHGIERWRSNCGCNMGRKDWSQAWRRPLREAMDWLRDELAVIYEKAMAEYVRDAWRARDEYVDIILDRSDENVARFFAAHARREWSKDDEVRVFRLLEMQRHAMLMYTSCGWFFDEISGIETTQVMAYAARAIQLAEKTAGVDLEPQFIEMLRRASANIAEHPTGADVYRSVVKPMMVDLLRVGAHYAVSSLFEDYADETAIYAYKAKRQAYERSEAGRQKLAIGCAHLRSNVTAAESRIAFAVLHLGDHNLLGGVREFADEASFAVMRRDIKEAFNRSDLAEIIRLMDKHFETHNYSLWHLFRDEQRRVWDRILKSTVDEVAGSFRRIYSHHYPIMRAMREQRAPLPKALLVTAELTINGDLRRAIENPEFDAAQVAGLIEEVDRWRFEVDRTTLGFVASLRAQELMNRFTRTPQDSTPLAQIHTILVALERLALPLDLFKVRNQLFVTSKQMLREMIERNTSGDTTATEWIKRFIRLSDHLRHKSA